MVKTAKAYLLLLAVFWQFSLLYSQNAALRVSSSGDGGNLPYAHVTFWPVEGQSAKSIIVISDNDGFVVSPIEGVVVAHVTYVGFQDFIDTLFPGNIRTILLQMKASSLESVVVTAQHSEVSPEKAIHQVRIISRDEMEQLAATTLKDILTNETNIRLSQDNILGSSISLQGISGQNVKILIDGVPVVGRLNGNIDISQINLSNIERVEIIRGPLSVNFGTDALAGTINLITKKSQENPVEIGFNSYWESIGQYNLDGNLGWQFEKGRVSLTGGRNFFDGWAEIDTARTKQWKPKEQYFSALQASWNPRFANITWQSSWFDELITNRGDRRKPYYETAFDDYYHTRRLDNSIHISGLMGSKGKFVFQASGNHYRRIKNTYFKNLVTLEEVLTQNEGDQDTSVFRHWMVRGNYIYSSVNKIWSVETGVDLNHEQGTGIRIAEGGRTIGDYALYSTAEIKPNTKLSIRPGIRYAYNTDYKAPFIPSLNIYYQLNTGIAFRASWAKGFRSPSIKELGFLFVDINHNIRGNENLLAEHSDNYSASITGWKASGKRIWHFGLSGYYNSIRDMITLALVEKELYTYVNIGQMKTTGLDTRVKLVNSKLSSEIAVAMTGRKSDVAEGIQSVKFSYSPELTFDIKYHFKRVGIQGALFYKFTGKYPVLYIDEDEMLQENFIASFHAADLTFSKSFWDNKISLTAGVKNLFDVKEVIASMDGGIHAGSNGTVPVSWGRSFFAKLKFNFTK